MEIDEKAHHHLLIDKLQPVGPQDHIAEAARKILLVHFVAFLDSAPNLNQDMTEDVLAVSCSPVNKLRTVFDLLGHEYDPTCIKHFRKRLRKLAEALKEVRDLDMMIHDLVLHGITVNDRMTIAGTVAHLEAKRLVAIEDLETFLESKKYRRFLKDFESFLTDVELDDCLREETSPATPYQVRHVLPVLLHQQVARVNGYEVLLKDPTQGTTDNLFIEVRRLRHMLSFFEGVLGTSVVEYMRAVQTLEDHLAQLSYLYTTLAKLIHMPRLSFTPAQIDALKDYRQGLKQQQAALLADLPDAWDAFQRRAVMERLMRALLVLV